MKPIIVSTVVATATLLILTTGIAHAENSLTGMNAWVEGQLASNQSSLSAYIFLMLGGLLASLLPCVYPLYPITASIIAGRSQGDAPRALHPSVYYVGLASIYFLFGLIAAATGGAFNDVLRLPITNLMLALLFLMLALATAGFLHVSLFSGNGIGDKTPGLAGTFMMGMGAGLLSSSCVGPFVVGILVGIASQTDGLSFFATLTAALKMLAFGLGLGVPFLLIGLFGVRLPKSGSWMKYVQWALGALILYFAYTYLEKALSGYGFKPEHIQLVFFGALLLLFSLYHLWEGEHMHGFRRMEKSLFALFALVGGLVLAQGVLTPSATATIHTSTNLASAPVTETKGELTWYLNREDAVTAAREQGKPIFVDFFAYWCANCKEFEHLTETDRELIDGLKKVVLLKIYDNDPEFKQYQNDKRYPELKVGLPFFIIADADDHLIYKTSDYTRTDEMLLFMAE
ncbi:MAG: cytochrome c biogenesis protein CcdA [Methylovulum sp.]|uniref:protein-disulfide reductase DsbD family protein n=1 Tax=Methylovulum sp. TaxID=1916980 RepID=UPI002611653D|nr:cytochrome c biogenesis protein CcdA [Methylovulum sp.]MDD2722618.1 cytochrome c biogenesis protein CcdA [Methylovulum sp.]MDD5123784.1 cytochrome c biogenesis protein CcdA [Methylovulum sp.]